MEKEITIKINTEELDIAIKKASQLLEILKEIQKDTDSLPTKIRDLIFA